MWSGAERIARLCGVVCLIAGGSLPATAATTFVDVTASAGLSHLQYDPSGGCVIGPTGCDVDRMSGGAAVADVDLDGLPDLYVTRLDAPGLLFRNLGDGTFEDATVAAGLAAFDIHGNGALFGDIDNDGDPDLFVTVMGAAGDPVNDRNYLFVNDGNGVFAEEASLRGAAVPSQTGRLSQGAAFGDFDRDGWLDLVVSEWLLSGSARLLRGLGSGAPGHFEDVTAQSGLVFEGVNGFAPALVDLDGDGWQDLAVAADFGTSRLFWNRRDGSFQDGTAAAGVGGDENGMGSTFGDFDGDGDLDWFVTSIDDPQDTCASENCEWGASGNRLYRNLGGRAFSDATDAAGVRAGYWGWGTVFFDMDNDADLDLVMTNGMLFESTSIEDHFNADPMRLWENDGSGQMAEVSVASGVDDTGAGKGLLSFDYDLDGDLDLFVVNNAGQPVLYRNDLPAGSAWVRVQVEGTRSNRDGLGARVRVWSDLAEAPQVREIGASSHYLAQSERVAHFGLPAGVSHVARIEVVFPASGRRVIWPGLPVGATYRIHEELPGCGLLGPEAALACGWLLRRRGRRRATVAATARRNCVI